MFPKVSVFSSAAEVPADILGVFCGEMHLSDLFQLENDLKVHVKIVLNFFDIEKKSVSMSEQYLRLSSGVKCGSRGLAGGSFLQPK